MNRGGRNQVAVIRQRLGELGVGLATAEVIRLGIRARDLVRSGAVRNIRAGLRRAFQQLRAEAQRPRTATTLAQRIGVGPDAMNTIPRKRGAGALLPEYDSGGTQTDPPVKDAGGYTQIEYSKGAGGNRLNKVQRVMKTLAATIYSKIDRFQLLGTSSSAEGRYQLALETIGASPNNERLLPLYMFDLTCMDQYAGANYYPNPFVRLKYRDNIDQYDWDPILARNADDTGNVYSWTTEKGPRQTPTGTYNNKTTLACFHDWCDINMMIFGSRNYPTRVQVSLVQFTDELYVPNSYQSTIASTAGTVNSTNCTSLTGTDKEQYRDFWLTFTSPMLQHPLAKKGATKVASNMKVLYKKMFYFNPTTSDEANDPRAHQNLFKFRYHMGKVVRYDDHPADPAEGVADAEIIDPDEYPQYDFANDTSTFCNAKGRVFLMITGYAPVETTGVPLNYYNYPSFDLQVRRKTNHVHGITHMQ